MKLMLNKEDSQSLNIDWIFDPVRYGLPIGTVNEVLSKILDSDIIYHSAVEIRRALSRRLGRFDVRPQF